ncbi:MAG: hypothetical protein ACI8RW_001270 [Porticoccaceae bacterium]|jgi:hypothetical protein
MVFRKAKFCICLAFSLVCVELANASVESDYLTELTKVRLAGDASTFILETLATSRRTDAFQNAKALDALQDFQQYRRPIKEIVPNYISLQDIYTSESIIEQFKDAELNRFQKIDSIRRGIQDAGVVLDVVSLGFDSYDFVVNGNNALDLSNPSFVNIKDGLLAAGNLKDMYDATLSISSIVGSRMSTGKAFRFWTNNTFAKGYTKTLGAKSIVGGPLKVIELGAQVESYIYTHFRDKEINSIKNDVFANRAAESRVKQFLLTGLLDLYLASERNGELIEQNDIFRMLSFKSGFTVLYGSLRNGEDVRVSDEFSGLANSSFYLNSTFQVNNFSSLNNEQRIAVGISALAHYAALEDNELTEYLNTVIQRDPTLADIIFGSIRTDIYDVYNTDSMFNKLFPYYRRMSPIDFYELTYGLATNGEIARFQLDKQATLGEALAKATRDESYECLNFNICSDLPKITNVSATDNALISSIRVTWDSEPTALIYNIYRCTSSGLDSCTYFASADRDVKEYEDFYVSTGESYYYRLEGCDNNSCSIDLSEADEGSSYVPSDSMRHISDAVLDGTVFDQGESFTQNWTVRNSGGTTWDSSYCLKHRSGVLLGNNTSVCVSGTVRPGENYVFSVTMTAPIAVSSNQTYRDNWTLHKGSSSFSGSIWTEVVVRGVTPLADAPTNFTATQNGASIIDLSWSGSETGSVYRLSRSTSQNSGFGLLGEINALTFVDDGRRPNTRYYYRLSRCISNIEATCSTEFATATVVTNSAQDASSLISSFSISGNNFTVGQTINMSAEMVNSGGIANNERFNFVFALSDNQILDAEDEILFRAAETNFVLLPGSTESYNRSYTFPDGLPSGTKNIIACSIYRDFSDDSQQICQSRAVSISSQPLDIPSSPDSPILSYQQGQNQIGVFWNSASGGGFYRVERSLSSSSGFSEVYSGTEFSFLDQGLVSGTTYYYRLKSCQNSLPQTCSGSSSSTLQQILSSATNDFFMQNMKIFFSGSKITLEAEQRYSGTSVARVRPNAGFFVSPDVNCPSSNRLFLGASASSLSISDVFDVEEIIADYPAVANSGTWYACAVADYDEREAESNENNNILTVTAHSDVPAPSLEPLKTLSGSSQLRVTWPSVPGNVEYRLARSTSPNGPFNNFFYIGTGRSVLDNVGLASCSEYYYQLFSCNGSSGNSACSSSPIVNRSTLPISSPAPQVTVLGENKIEVSWGAVDCADYYILNRKRPNSTTKDRVSNGPESSYVDILVFPGLNYGYSLDYCTSEQGFFNNGCAARSAEVSATPQAMPLLDQNWSVELNDTELAGRQAYSQIVFNNRAWIVGGTVNGQYMNDVWVTDDGLDWNQVVVSAPFSGISRANLVVNGDRLYLIGGRLEAGRYSKQVWSTSNGIDWRLETSSAPFKDRSSSVVESLNDRMFLIAGTERDSTGQFVGNLRDVWSSADGKNWTLETNTAQFGLRRAHRSIVANGRIYVYGGSGKIGTNLGDKTYNDIWSSANGRDWLLEKENLPYGARDIHSVVEFDNKYWLVAGRRAIQNDADRDNSNQRFDIDRTVAQEDDVWVSSDALTWNIVDKATIIPTSESVDAINFNNRIWVGRLGSSTRWSARYGHVVGQPDGEISITGAPLTGGVLTSDISDIGLNLDGGKVTYQWFKNGIAEAGEVGGSLSLSGYQIGDIVQLRVRFTDEKFNFFSFEASPVEIQFNPIVATFELTEVVGEIGQQGVQNSLKNLSVSQSVLFSVINSQVATVINANNEAEVDMMSVGATRVEALITDSSVNASKTISFDVTVTKGNQDFSFGVSTLSKAENSLGFNLPLVEVGQGSGAIQYFSSNTAVASVSSNGNSVDIFIGGVGNTTISAVKAQDDSFLTAQASLVLNIFDGDSDGDGVADDIDNCPSIVNPNQLNLDGDSKGDLCDPDGDGDFVVNASDCAPVDVQRWLNRNGFNDTDLDGVGSGLSISVCSGQSIASPFVSTGDDNCPSTANAGQENFDLDEQGDVCDSNDDNDPFDDILDCADRDNSRWQLLDGYLDVDEDGVGFGIIDQICSGTVLPEDYATRTGDNCQFDVNTDQLNSDDDELGNACDADDDNDEILDDDDNCSLVSNNDQADDDRDGIGDACEVKSDGSICFPVLTNNDRIAIICL